MLPSNIGLLVSLLVSIFIILASLMLNVPIGYALILIWLCFAYALYRQGYSLKDLLRMSWTSATHFAYRLVNSHVASIRYHSYDYCL